MQFNIDHELLGEPRVFPAHGLEVSPPRGWTALPADQLAALAAAGGEQPAAESGFHTTPLAVFGDPATGLLIVSEVTGPGIQAYESQLNERWGDVQPTQYTVNGVLVHQYLIQPEGQVNFKLLLAPTATSPAAERDGPRWLQLDYLAPMAEYERQVRAVESSIGSVRPVRGMAGMQEVPGSGRG